MYRVSINVLIESGAWGIENPESPACFFLDPPLSVQYIPDFLHFAANIRFGYFCIMAGHVDVGVAEYLGDDVDRHPVFDGKAGERVTCRMCRQVFTDVTDCGDFFEVTVHLLVARHGQ